MASFPIDLERLDRLEQNFTNFAADLKELDSARLPGRLALLEGACLEERLALLESMINTGGVFLRKDSPSRFYRYFSGT